MFGALVGLTFAMFLSVVFLVYCRRLLARTSEIELSEAALRAIATQGDRVSSVDFHRLRALVLLCPLDQKDGASLAAVCAYYALLTGLHAISSRTCEGFAEWTEQERRSCAHFVAVTLDRRIARARKLWAEQMIQPGKEEESSPRSS